MLVKLGLAPGLVVLSSLAGRRWGPAVTGVLVALPVVAGPILAIIAVEQGPIFGARAAASSLLGLVTLALFAVVVSVGARRGARWRALLAGLAACLLADALLATIHPPAWLGLIAALGGATAARSILSRIASRMEPAHVEDLHVSVPSWDLPARAVATAALVLVVTGAAGAVGPAASGVLAPFPIATTVVTTFTLVQHGARATVRLLEGLCRGLLGFSVFCYLAAVLLVPLGAVATFLLATAAAVSTQVLMTQTARARRVLPAGLRHLSATAPDSRGQ